MRRQVRLLVAMVSTAIVASFVFPLLFLVGTLAEDRGMAVASQQASTIALLVASLHDDAQLADLLQSALTASPAQASVVLADGLVLGSTWSNASGDPAYQRAKQGEAFSVRDADGGRVYVPVLVEGGVAVARATMTRAQLDEGVPLAWASITALGVALSALSVLVAARVGSGVSRPLLDVAETAHRLREGDLTARASLAGPTETVELGSALNGLADRVEQLLAAERDTVRSLAHRLRTPVTALRLEAENTGDPEARADLTELVGQLQTAIDDVVRDARRPLREDLPGDCDPVAVVADRIAYWRPLAEDQERSLDVSLPAGELRVGLSALELGDVVDICVDNVFAHTPEGTALAIKLTVSDEEVSLLVRDGGPGFPGERGDPRPGTSGMGMKIAQGLVERAHGRLATSPAGRECGEVRVLLPVKKRAHPATRVSRSHGADLVHRQGLEP